MANVYIKNTRECDITLHIGNEAITIARGTMTPVGFAPGIAKIDDALLKEGMKHPVIKSYFEDGYLIKDGKAPEPPKSGGNDDDDGDKTPEYLVGNVSEVTGKIKALATELLTTAAEQEKAGLNRKGVLDAIEYEIKSRNQA